MDESSEGEEAKVKVFDPNTLQQLKNDLPGGVTVTSSTTTPIGTNEDGSTKKMKITTDGPINLKDGDEVVGYKMQGRFDRVMERIKAVLDGKNSKT